MENVLLTEYCQSNTGGGGSDPITATIFCTGQVGDLWGKFKKQADQYLAGCKETMSTNFPNDSRAKQYNCSNGMKFYAYITEKSPEIARFNNKKWHTTKGDGGSGCYNGENFDKFVGKDKTNAAMTLLQFIQDFSPKKDEKVIDYTQEKKKTTIKSSWNEGCKGTYSMSCKTPEVGQAQQCLKDQGLYN